MVHESLCGYGVVTELGISDKRQANNKALPLVSSWLPPPAPTTITIKNTKPNLMGHLPLISHVESRSINNIAKFWVIFAIFNEDVCVLKRVKGGCLTRHETQVCLSCVQKALHPAHVFAIDFGTCICLAEGEFCCHKVVALFNGLLPYAGDNRL